MSLLNTLGRLLVVSFNEFLIKQITCRCFQPKVYIICIYNSSGVGHNTFCGYN